MILNHYPAFPACSIRRNGAGDPSLANPGLIWPAGVMLLAQIYRRRQRSAESMGAGPQKVENTHFVSSMTFIELGN